MGGATRVLVTNALHFLPRCDYVYVIKDETIAEEGTYEELINRDSLLVEMGALPTTPSSATAATAASNDQSSSASSDIVGMSAQTKEESNCNGMTPVAKSLPEQLVKAEDRKYGKVELRTYTRYIRSGATGLVRLKSLLMLRFILYLITINSHLTIYFVLIYSRLLSSWWSRSFSRSGSQ